MQACVVRFDWNIFTIGILFVLMLYIPLNNFSVTCREDFLPGLNQYQAVDKVSCSRTQHSDSGESPTSNPSIPSLTLYQLLIVKIWCVTMQLRFYIDQIRVNIYNSHDFPPKWWKRSQKLLSASFIGTLRVAEVILALKQFSPISIKNFIYLLIFKIIHMPFQYECMTPNIALYILNS